MTFPTRFSDITPRVVRIGTLRRSIYNRDNLTGAAENYKNNTLAAKVAESLRPARQRIWCMAYPQETKIALEYAHEFGKELAILAATIENNAGTELDGDMLIPDGTRDLDEVVDSLSSAIQNVRPRAYSLFKRLIDALDEVQADAAGNPPSCPQDIHAGYCTECATISIDRFTMVDSNKICAGCIDTEYVFSQVEGTHLGRNDADYSEIMDDYIPSDDAVPLFDNAQAVRSGIASDHATQRWLEQNTQSHDYQEVDPSTMCERVASDGWLHTDIYWEFHTSEDDYDDDSHIDSASAQRDSSPYIHPRHSSKTKQRRLHVDGVSINPENARRYVPLMGMEIEVESTDNNPRWSADRLRRYIGADYCFFEEDGSLDHGFELVTHYGNWQEHAAKLSWATEDTADSCYVTAQESTTGLHIHLGTAGMTPMQAVRIHRFITAPGNAYWLETFARREWSTNRYCKIKQTNDVVKALMAAYRLRRSNSASLPAVSDHFDAVNFGSKTVEFRMFQSSLNRNVLIASLQFVHNLALYTRQCSHAPEALTPKAFMAWCQQPENLRDTAMLRGYVASLKIDDTEGYTSAPISQPRRGNPTPVGAVQCRQA